MNIRVLIIVFYFLLLLNITIHITLYLHGFRTVKMSIEVKKILFLFNEFFP